MKKNQISRRKFLGMASMGVAGSYVALHPVLGRAANHLTATTALNLAAGSFFRDPVEAVPNAFGVYEIQAREAMVNVNGTMARLLTYNGTCPGPTIRCRKGEMLKIKLINGLPPTSATNILGHVKNITNLHTHGLHVSPNPPADSMMIQLKPGESYDYVYDLMYEEPGHLNFYHPHVHGRVAEQMWGGMAGALVVEDELPVLADYETHIMVLKDITLSGSVPAPYTMRSEYMQGKEGATVLVNGQANPVLPIRPGQVQRWRIVNACTAKFFKLSLENHSFYLVGTDGGLLDKPYHLTSLLLSPGERVDILVKADQSAKDYRFLSLPYSRRGNMTSQQVTLLTLSYTGSSTQETLPVSVNPAAQRLSLDLTSLTRRTIALSMGQGVGYINGQTFTDMENTFTIMSNLGKYEIWDIVNQSGMDHPFHQHVNSSQILSITGGDSAYASLYTRIPAWKDVVIVPKWGRVSMLVPVMDYPGMAMFHCHIIEHEDIGMMGAWHIMEMPM